MRTDGIIRRFDDLGRIVIPREIRSQLFGTPEESEGMPMEIFMDKDEIILRKFKGDEYDYKCNWKRIGSNTFKTECGYKENYDNLACYCKHCGNKICIRI